MFRNFAPDCIVPQSFDLLALSQNPATELRLSVGRGCLEPSLGGDFVSIGPRCGLPRPLGWRSGFRIVLHIRLDLSGLSNRSEALIKPLRNTLTLIKNSWA